MTAFTLNLDPLRARLVSGQYGRVVLAANNPAITAESLARLALTPDDILVQFNKSALFGLFAETACHKVHVLNANGKGGYWGFNAEGQPEPDVRAQAHGELTVYFTRHLNGQAKAYLASLAGAAQGGLMAGKAEPQFFPYPADRWPSAGFMAMGYYREVNMLRLFLGRPPLALVLLGFTGTYPPGQGWKQHGFAYEQSVYQTLLDVMQLSADGSAV
jgi:hypothetical protein